MECINPFIMKSINYLLVCGLVLIAIVVTPVVKAQSSAKHARLEIFKPGEVWPDKDGNHIQAH